MAGAFHLSNASGQNIAGDSLKMLSFTRGVKQNVFQRTFLVPWDLMSLTQQISVAFASPRSLKMRNQAVSWFNSLQDFQTPA
ncbi:hypothetical protein CU103_21640 [Phyllobacterium sophorae]|uniref:Uncharacterized protein n=1 Tax=Phyllobacterium sophorae TaxID=1520277 RepID=A0A2P7B632_9HYPH|nr:hypothetical protein CU103_21640 [Phyllobacterium sophorae]